jgi:hypothetical protein
MKTILLFLTVSLTFILSATTLECRDIYTTVTSQRTGEAYKTNGDRGNQTAVFKIVTDEENFYVVSADLEKVKLAYLGQGMGNFYFYETTSGGNINLYSLFKDGTLTVSKSYDVLGMSKMNVQSIYQCR